jgi:hypothetical protein
VWECRWPCGLLLCLGTLAIAGNAAVSQTLLPGVTVEGEMSAGQRQFYALRAEAGEFFQVTLRQQGIDVVLAVTGAGGARESDFSDGPQGREVVSLIAAAPGDVLIEVRAREGAVGAGRYALALSPPRSASPSDRDRMAAEDLLSRAFALQKDGKAESFREAADSFAKARVLWRALDERFFEGLCLLREGVCRRRLGEHHRARELFEEALPHWRALGEPSFEAKTLDALGTADYFLNDYEKALAGGRGGHPQQHQHRPRRVGQAADLPRVAGAGSRPASGAGRPPRTGEPPAQHGGRLLPDQPDAGGPGPAPGVALAEPRRRRPAAAGLDDRHAGNGVRSPG